MKNFLMNDVSLGVVRKDTCIRLPRGPQCHYSVLICSCKSVMNVIWTWDQTNPRAHPTFLFQVSLHIHIIIILGQKRKYIRSSTKP